MVAHWKSVSHSSSPLTTMQQDCKTCPICYEEYSARDEGRTLHSAGNMWSWRLFLLFASILLSSCPRTHKTMHQMSILKRRNESRWNSECTLSRRRWWRRRAQAVEQVPTPAWNAQWCFSSALYKMQSTHFLHSRQCHLSMSLWTWILCHPQWCPPPHYVQRVWITSTWSKWCPFLIHSFPDNKTMSSLSCLDWIVWRMWTHCMFFL